MAVAAPEVRPETRSNTRPSPRAPRRRQRRSLSERVTLNVVVGLIAALLAFVLAASLLADRRDAAFGQLGRRHFRLQIVGRHLGRCHENPLLARIDALLAAVEEERDVRVLLRLRHAQLLQACPCHDLAHQVVGGRGGERVQYVDFKPDFSDRLFFIHMGKKQDSREGIRRYRAMVKDRADLVEKVTLLTKALLESRDEDTFGEVMAAHEKLVGEALGLQPVQEKYFPDFPGRIKSLGAWGGDFILALSPWESEGTKRYFGQKQLGTVLSWDAMVG